MKNDIEFRKMLGICEQLDDGFTYSYGGELQGMDAELVVDSVKTLYQE